MGPERRLLWLAKPSEAAATLTSTAEKTRTGWSA